MVKPPLSARLTAALLVGLTKLISGAQARWQGCEPSPRQRVYFANHSSHLDFTVLWSSLPPELRWRTRPVAAKDYWLAGPLRRYLAQSVFRPILIERGGPNAREAFEQILDGLGTEQSLILFPEGTRSLDGAVAPFKSGLYRLSRSRPDLELVPVLLENLNRILPKGETLPVPLLSSATFGAPLAAAPGETKAAFLERARQAVLNLRQA
ncbi:MAG TPA: lysophospholipid acyltransferase family protein [bacterium]|nr:lysophospholipid acyltransferase family protein [bacterium]